jgi:hypothetical protein
MWVYKLLFALHLVSNISRRRAALLRLEIPAIATLVPINAGPFISVKRAVGAVGITSRAGGCCSAEVRAG